jgi:hypothetical protein
MDWKPKARISAETSEGEPIKPSKPGFVGFEGVTSVECSEIEVGPDPGELAHASAILNRAGVRIMSLDGGTTVGVWSDLDGPEVRAALRTLGLYRLTVRYLDGTGVPTLHKVRRVEGEPVPMNVLAEMERHSAEPWKVRDGMLNEMGWCAKGNPAQSGRRRRSASFSKSWAALGERAPLRQQPSGMANRWGLVKLT